MYSKQSLKATRFIEGVKIGIYLAMSLIFTDPASYLCCVVVDWQMSSVFFRTAEVE